jgi:hypothetical protein
MSSPSGGSPTRDPRQFQLLTPQAYNHDLSDIVKTLEVIEMVDPEEYYVVARQIRHLEDKCYKMLNGFHAAKKALELKTSLAERNFNHVQDEMKALKMEDLKYIFQSM